METYQLTLKSVNQLFEYSFFIPSYQRGYRWTKKQVTQLLDDIWEFVKNPPIQEPGKEKPFYCLQPIVVKKNNDNWEVIDGQQRLTTLFLILKRLVNVIETSKKTFSDIVYETRVDSGDFLKNVEIKKADETNDNIDYYHIWKAYNTIQEWFQDKADNSDDATPSASIAPTFLNNTKIIWYEINETENVNSIDIFTRLNIGKIPLTNAELIKALFLQKGNFTEEKAKLQQIQIASEWDIIEKTLRDDAFWFFIYNPEKSLKYDNRIEYIFDLMQGRTKDSDPYHTFNKFYEEFQKNRLDNNPNKPDIEKIWMDIKRYFLTFDEWFKDHELFHYIGFLIDCGMDVSAIKDNMAERTKLEFKSYLKEKIKEQVKCNIDDLAYGDRMIKKILLLFNIQTVLETQKSDMRFPFNKYKSEDWDIEHVCSQTDKSINQQNRLDWINDMLDYFIGSDDIEKAQGFISDDENGKKICNLLIDLKKQETIEDGPFTEAYELTQAHFKENSQTEQKDDISNLTLLDASTNRSYKNAFFPIKRRRIIQNDKNGIFVPIGTKNVFLKYYSKKMDEIMYWEDSDARDYLEALKNTLQDFLSSREDK